MTLCLLRILLALGGALSGLPVIAQGLPSYQIYRDSAEIVSVNRDRLIQSSEFGKALVNVLTTRQQQLVEENASLALDLEREERELTDARKTLTPEEFGPLAKIFDNKVKDVRRRQERKAVELSQALEEMRGRFFNQTERLIRRLMEENNIVFVLDESAVWITQGGDFTDVVIERLDVAYQAGDLSLE
jgi:Skp family chaperone for outer membrane proteins